jgi:hypothetical protein
MGKNKIAEALQKISGSSQGTPTQSMPQLDKKYLTEKGEMPTLSQFWTKSNSINNDFSDAGDTNKMLSQLNPAFNSFFTGNVKYIRPNNRIDGNVVSGISKALDVLADLNVKPEEAEPQLKILMSNPKNRKWLFGENNIIFSGDDFITNKLLDANENQTLIAQTIGDLYKKTHRQYNDIYKTAPPSKKQGVLNQSETPVFGNEQQLQQINPKLRVIKKQ